MPRRKDFPASEAGRLETKAIQRSKSSYSLRVLHDCHQATVGGGTVVLGDKSHAEVWKLFNDGCCLDIGERGQAAGGRDLVVEVKAWASLHADSTPLPHADLARRGATHGFGDTLEHAIRKVRGVRARHGDERWSHARGVGRVSYHPGDYDDAQRRKHNELVLFLVETSVRRPEPACPTAPPLAAPPVQGHRPHALRQLGGS